MFQKIFHLTVTVIYLWTILEHCKIQQLMDQDQFHKTKLPFPRMFIFLTMINVIMNFMYNLLNLFGVLNKNQSSTFSKLFISVLCPISLIVSVYFWYMKIFVPNLLMNPKTTEYFSDLYLHASHTTQFFSIGLEVWWVDHTSQASQKQSNSEIFMSGLRFLAAYGIWITNVFMMFGIFPYPFLYDLWKTPGKIGMIGFLMVSSVVSFVFAKICQKVNIARFDSKSKAE